MDEPQNKRRGSDAKLATSKGEARWRPCSRPGRQCAMVAASPAATWSAGPSEFRAVTAHRHLHSPQTLQASVPGSGVLPILQVLWCSGLGPAVDSSEPEGPAAGIALIGAQGKSRLTRWVLRTTWPALARFKLSHADSMGHPARERCYHTPSYKSNSAPGSA